MATSGGLLWDVPRLLYAHPSHAAAAFVFVSIKSQTQPGVALCQVCWVPVSASPCHVSLHVPEGARQDTGHVTRVL